MGRLPLWTVNGLPDQSEIECISVSERALEALLRLIPPPRPRRWALRAGIRRIRGRKVRQGHWFAHPEMQARIARAEDDLANGRYADTPADEYMEDLRAGSMASRGGGGCNSFPSS
jgi:hypothetical protein